jgi:signal transduction histidine kinase
MNSLFARTYIVLILLMLVGFILTVFLTDNILEASDGQFFQRDATVEARLIETELLQQAPENWEDYVSAYVPVFETAVSLLDVDNVMASEFAPIVSLDSDTIVTGESFASWWLLHPLPDKNRFLLIEEEEGPITLEDWLSLLVPLLFLTTIVGCALWYIARYLAKPINALSSVAQALGQGQLDARADEKVLQPIHSLARNLNNMAGDLQRLINDQQVIIGALPHELRTPISRARFALDMTRSIDTVKALRPQLEKVDEYVSGLESVVEDSLTLSRLQLPQLSDAHDNVRFELDAMVANLCEQRLSATHKTLSWDCLVHGPVYGDESLVRMAIGNLANNAFKYAHSEVQITCRRLPDNAIEVIVDDDGIGIPESQREAVFTPFYRIDSSRSRATGGVGLGLAIVAMIARRMHGTVTASTNEQGGAQMKFCWPQPESIETL